MLIASLLAVTTAALLLYVLTANAHSFASRADDARLQTAAFIASEKALKTCTSEGGAAKCSDGFVFVNELYAAAPTAAQANESLGAEEKRACVSRIVLVGGEQQIAVFCTGEGGLN